MKKRMVLITTLCLLVFSACGVADASAEQRIMPVGLSPIAVIAGFEHSLVILEDNSLWGWGWFVFGPNIEAHRTFSHMPVHIMDNVADVYVGVLQTTILTTADGLYSVGHLTREITQFRDGADAISRFGGSDAWVRDDGSLMARFDDEIVHIADNMTDAAFTDRHILAISADGRLLLVDRTNLEYVFALDRIAAIAAHGDDAFVITADGTLFAFDGFGFMHIMDNVTTVSTVRGNVLAITSDGALWTWGRHMTGHNIWDDEIMYGIRPEPVKIMDAANGFVPDYSALLGRWHLHATSEMTSAELQAADITEYHFHDDGTMDVVTRIAGQLGVDGTVPHRWEIGQDGRLTISGEDINGTFGFRISRRVNSAGAFDGINIFADGYFSGFSRCFCYRRQPV